jgi:hypothetical protein
VFWLREVQFLGHVINPNGFMMDTAKVEAVMKWSPPKTPSKIRSFLVLARYYMRFIQDFSKIAAPLTRLTKKEVGNPAVGDTRMEVGKHYHGFPN